MTDADLLPFVAAQEGVYGDALAELKAGRKATHWMWFVFPQMAGLGMSAMAQRYAIADLDHARRYLRDPLLGGRLRDCTDAMLAAKSDASAHDILGSPDDLKFRSCMTLFAEAAQSDEDRRRFAAALHRFCDGAPDPATLRLLAQP